MRRVEHPSHRTGGSTLPSSKRESLVAPGSARVAIADDDAGSRALLRAILEREGCSVRESADGAGTLRMVDAEVPEVLLLDVSMPAPNGIEVTKQLRRRFSEAELPIILVTGYQDTPTKIHGLEAGASDFVTKPYEAPELVARVRAALRTRAAFDRLESAQSVISAVASAVEAKDPTTEQHCSRLAELALNLARSAGVSPETLEAIAFGAVLHDVGKIGVRESIIRKLTPLDDDEWIEMRTHPAIGAAIVAPLRMGRLVAPIVRGHHERWDGLGYPDGLAAAAIPLGARIVGVVDAYDAMVHDRPYRARMSDDQARSQLIAHSGSQFDPELARVFVDHLDTRNAPERATPAADEIWSVTRGLLDEPVRQVGSAKR